MKKPVTIKLSVFVSVRFWHDLKTDQWKWTLYYHDFDSFRDGIIATSARGYGGFFEALLAFYAAFTA